MEAKTKGSPVPALSANRRQLLLGLGAAGMVVSRAKAEERQVTEAPAGHSSDAKQRVPFYGVHQAGIVTPRPANGMIVSCDLIAQTPKEFEQFLRQLTERIVFLTSGGSFPQVDDKLPPADSGILGPDILPDNLTITVAFGASLFSNRPWLEPFKPKHLQRMTSFANDALDSQLCHGDLSIQFSSNTADTNIHALRDLLKNLTDYLVLRWKQEGSVPMILPRPDGKTESARNFLGFRDGSANPASSDKELMQRVVWVSKDSGEPEWAESGTYQAVRIIRNFVERWDRTPLGEQERIMGRKKMSGAPFNGREEHDEPDYSNDPDGAVTRLDSHIRLANPRDAIAKEHLILRRPFNYSNGVTKSGHLDQGLLFIAYQSNLEKGFIAVQNRLKGEPLEEYIKPVGGGYFYVLPGVQNPGDYLGRKLVEAALSVEVKASKT